jgi:hypothetical protein
MNFAEEEIKENNLPTLSTSISPTPKLETEDMKTLDTISFFDFKTILIFLLLFFLILTFIGINLFTILGNSLQDLSNVLSPFFINFTKAFGYSTGTVINTSADTVSNVAKTGIDIVDGSAKDIGNLFISAAGEDNPNPTNPKHTEPKPDDSTNSIQKPITSDKSNWCLVGEFQNKRGCVAITDSDKCLSGQIFPNQAMCLNPTLTP